MITRWLEWPAAIIACWIDPTCPRKLRLSSINNPLVINLTGVRFSMNSRVLRGVLNGDECYVLAAAFCLQYCVVRGSWV